VKHWRNVVLLHPADTSVSMSNPRFHLSAGTNFLLNSSMYHSVFTVTGTSIIILEPVWPENVSTIEAEPESKSAHSVYSHIHVQGSTDALACRCIAADMTTLPMYHIGKISPIYIDNICS